VVTFSFNDRVSVAMAGAVSSVLATCATRTSVVPALAAKTKWKVVLTCVKSIELFAPIV
jgi:hypothetical protein